ncbi:MAG: adenylosuccinate lyase, partial [Anaerolineae bacterium]|nr:adenylosuccinate lyase [Anaerolineae bacterium]
MPSNAIDSIVFRDMYGTDELRAVFSDESLLQCWLDFEAALARAEAAVGLVPASAAAEITRRARVENIDLPALRQGIYDTTHELVPLIWQLARLCDGDAGGWVHWGATTQDVTDTGL